MADHRHRIYISLLSLLGSLALGINAGRAADPLDANYTIPLGSAATNPADSTTYYMGQPAGMTWNTTSTNRQIKIPIAGTLKCVMLHITNNAGTQGSNENVSFYARLNDTTDTTITTTAQMNQASGISTQINTCGLTTAVAAGDNMNLKIVTPAFATNPTAVIVNANLLINTGSNPTNSAGYLENDGSGGLSWTTPASDLPAAADGWLYNDGSDNLSWTQQLDIAMGDNTEPVALWAWLISFGVFALIGLWKWSKR